MAKSSSKGKQAAYAAYKSENRFVLNRKRKLLKLQKEQPNNEQVTEALKNIRFRRKAPGAPVWSHTKINTAAMIAKYCKKEKAAKMHPAEEKKMFTLGARAHMDGGSFWKAS
jgi:hypothetical protein